MKLHRVQPRTPRTQLQRQVKCLDQILLFLLRESNDQRDRDAHA
jgi:hypothetical protein